MKNRLELSELQMRIAYTTRAMLEYWNSIANGKYTRENFLLSVARFFPAEVPTTTSVSLVDNLRVMCSYTKNETYALGEFDIGEFRSGLLYDTYKVNYRRIYSLMSIWLGLIYLHTDVDTYIDSQVKFKLQHE